MGHGDLPDTTFGVVVVIRIFVRIVFIQITIVARKVILFHVGVHHILEQVGLFIEVGVVVMAIVL